MRTLRHALARAAGHARPLAFAAALAAMTVGLWWERPSLALIVPGALVAAATAWAHLRGDDA